MILVYMKQFVSFYFSYFYFYGFGNPKPLAALK
jgi:hypothetical protein